MAHEHRPLEGFRILDLTQTLAGPYGSMLLADMGAEVIKVEHPERPDLGRNMGSCRVDDMSAYFVSLNRNKRSVSLDLKKDYHLEAFLRMVEVSDVVFENFRPGVAARLGLTEEVLTARNPNIVMCSLSGFGQEGPESQRPAYDYVIQALVGTMDLTGDPDGPPTKYGVSIVDHVGGVFAALSIVAALLGRQRNGVRDCIDVSLFDTHLSMLSYLASAYLNCGEEPQRQPYSSHPHKVPSQLLATQDGYLVVMVFDDHFWVPFCDAVGLPELVDDFRFATAERRRARRDELTNVLQAQLALRPTDVWIASLQERGVPAAQVQSIPEALRMEHVRVRDMIIELDHPEYGRHRVIGNPVKFSSMPKGPRVAAPQLGADTAQVLTEICGMTPAEVDALTGDRSAEGGSNSE